MPKDEFEAACLRDFETRKRVVRRLESDRPQALISINNLHLMIPQVASFCLSWSRQKMEKLHGPARARPRIGGNPQRIRQTGPFYLARRMRCFSS